MRKYLVIPVVLILSIFVFNSIGQQLPSAKTDKKLQSISNNDIQKIKEKKIFFGHQSVGDDILKGLKIISGQDGRFTFNIIERPKPFEFDYGILVHSRCGSNTNPESKIQDFYNKIDTKLKGKIDVALVKFCYVDFSWYMDVKDLFGKYKKAIGSLKKKYPKISFIHVTVPLRAADERTNVRRHEYNELIRKNYSAKDIVFDLAKIESHTPEGGKIYFNYQGKNYPKLYDQYTKDGGHF
jgi:hypothetical protein